VARSAPDPEAPQSFAQHSFASGEVSPSFYGRQDIQKYGSGCAIMRNWYVDVRGGATIRPGTQFIGYPSTTGYARLIPFQFSPDIGQSYILVFSAGKIRFIKNPGTAAYPNSSNAGFVESGGTPYEVVTPYAEGDLRGLHYVQMADVMWITCRGHPRMKLSRFGDNAWTLTPVSVEPGILGPTMISATISPSAGGVSPAPAEETRYMYTVSAVSVDGEESLPSVPVVSNAGINIGATQGTVTVLWYPMARTAYYKVWKALPAHGNRVPAPHEQFGFAGYSYGTTFTDSNIVPDFTQAPIQPGDPFAPGTLTGYAITNQGSGYTVGSTSVTVTDGTGTGAVVYPVLSTNIAGATASIVGLYIANPGKGYSAPIVSAVGTGTDFAATMTVGPSTGLDPTTVSLFQQRLVYASTDNKPKTLVASRPGFPDDFRVSNPVVDDDAFQFELFERQVARINWLHAMPGGLLIGSNVHIFQLTGGNSGSTNPVAVTPTNAVSVPQSQYGTADIDPIVVDHNVLYVQTDGTVRELSYNFYFNIYAGADLTILSNHFFNESRVVDWAFADAPNKIVWAVLDNGMVLSLTYLKAQEIVGWSRHDTQGGIVEAVTSIEEGGIDAVYFSINRGGTRWIERQAQQKFFQASDAWQLDGALSIASHYPAANATASGLTGQQVLTAASAVFSLGDVGKHINVVASRATVAQYNSPTQVLINIDPTRPFGSLGLPAGLWRMDPVVGVVTGLEHMNGTIVYALVDGVVQGPFTVSGGTITLTTPGSQIVVGYRYPAQLQPLYVETPEAGTIQGKRKKVAAASIRVRNAQGLKYGPNLGALLPWMQGTSSTDDPPFLPYSAAGLYSGDQRLWLDQEFSVGGWVCIQQDDPYPATVLSIMPELAMGDVQ
jgi:hypothetical protein